MSESDSLGRLGSLRQEGISQRAQHIVSDVCVYPRKRRNNREPSSWPFFAERYRDGFLQIRIRFRICSWSRDDCRDYLAVIKLADRSVLLHKDCAFCKVGRDPLAVRKAAQDRQVTVPVYARQFVEHEEGIEPSIRGLRSMIWLYPLDDSTRGGRKALNLVRAIIVEPTEGSATLFVKPVGVYREFDSMSLTAFSGRNGCEEPNHVIKGGTEVIDDLTDQHAHAWFREPVEFNVSDMPRLFGITLEMNTVRLVCKEPPDFFFKTLDVVVCPAPVRKGRFNPYDWMFHELHSGHEGSAHAEAPQGLRDTCPDTRRSGSRVQEGDEGGEAQVSAPPPEEVASRTAPARQRGGSTAKRTHSGSHEDA